MEIARTLLLPNRSSLSALEGRDELWDVTFIS